MRTYAHMEGKPLLTSWMGGTRAKTGRVILTEAGIPMFDYPDEAARAFANMWHYTESRLPRDPTLSAGEKPAPFAPDWAAKVHAAPVGEYS